MNYQNSFVNITVYDLLGKKVKTLVNSTQNAGFKSVIWDATNNAGKIMDYQNKVKVVYR